MYCLFRSNGVCRYEVQDPEPDDAGGHGKYKAFASALIPIPRDSTNLPPYPIGKQVLARYPETTTFYRAEVMGTKVRDDAFLGPTSTNESRGMERAGSSLKEKRRSGRRRKLSAGWSSMLAINGDAREYLMLQCYFWRPVRSSRLRFRIRSFVSCFKFFFT